MKSGLDAMPLFLLDDLLNKFKQEQTWKFQLDVVAKGMSRHLNVFLQLMKQILINLSQKSRLNWQDDWPPKKQDRKNSLIYWKKNRHNEFLSSEKSWCHYEIWLYQFFCHAQLLKNVIFYLNCDE